MHRITYKILKGGIKFFSKKPEIYGAKNVIKDKPAMFMSNHAGFYGPIIASCYFPLTDKVWANSMVIETMPTKEYVTRTLFKETLAWKNDFFAKIAGNITGSILSGLLQNENLVIAYWDAERARQTIISSINTAVDGESQYMFARNVKITDGKLSEEFKFDRGYSLVITQLLKKYNIRINLYPVAVNSHSHTVSIGNPTKINPEKSTKDELKCIDDYLISAVRLGYNNPEVLANG